LSEIGWGFIDEVYDLYKYGDEAYINIKDIRKKEREINQIVKSIKSTPKWFDRLKKESETTGENIDSLLTNNARYIYNKRHKEEVVKGIPQTGAYSFSKEALELGISEEALQKEHDKELFKIKKNIKETPSWLSKVEKDAKSKNISLEECLRQHAEFMLMKGKKEKWKQSH